MTNGRESFTCAATSFAIADTADCGKGKVIYLRPTERGLQGERTTIHLTEGFYLSVANIERSRPVTELYEGAGVLKLHCRLSGPSWVGIGGKSALTKVGVMSCGALIHPTGTIKTEVFSEAGTERSVTLSCTREFLRDHIGLDPDQSHGPFADFLRDGPLEFAAWTPKFSLAFRDLAERLIQDTDATAATRMTSYARSLDLLRLFTDMYQADRQDRKDAATRRLETARDILIREYSDPPTIPDLANRIGTNGTRLMQDFKQRYGQTIAAFVTEVRMQKAVELIDSGTMSITQIALEIGYSYPGNFATAFKRHFGYSPNQYQSAVSG